jgi:hypothetical protein
VVYKVYDTEYMFERHDQKTHRICVYGHFRELLSTVWGFWVFYKAHETQYIFETCDQKLFIFAF